MNNHRTLTTAYITGLLWLTLSGVLLGCPSPNLYGTARTVEPGKFSFTVAPEAVGFVVDEELATSEGAEKSELGPAMPSYRVRLGLAEQLDAAVVFGPLSLGGELKYNFFRSPFIDLALAPGYQWLGDSSINSGSFSAHYLALPAVIDLNLHRRVSLVMTPGVSFSWADGELHTDRFFGSGVSARLGLGVNVRLLSFLSLQPELTALMPLSEQQDGTQLRYHFGIGVSFLNGPDFSDVE